MCTLIFSLPDYLVQDTKFISVYRTRRSKSEKKWILDVRDELVDEYGADNPEDFEFVAMINKEVEITFEPDLA